jgi:hypothetical protein
MYKGLRYNFKIVIDYMHRMSSHPEAFPDLNDLQISINSAVLVGLVKRLIPSHYYS